MTFYIVIGVMVAIVLIVGIATGSACLEKS